MYIYVYSTHSLSLSFFLSLEMQVSFLISPSISLYISDVLAFWVPSLSVKPSARQEALQQMEAITSATIALNKFSYTAALSACEKGHLQAGKLLIETSWTSLPNGYVEWGK